MGSDLGIRPPGPENMDFRGSLLKCWYGGGMSVGGGEHGSLVFGVEDLVKLSLAFLLATKFPKSTPGGGLLVAAKILCLHNLAMSSLWLVGGGGCIKLGGLNHGNIEAEIWPFSIFHLTSKLD